MKIELSLSEFEVEQLAKGDAFTMSYVSDRIVGIAKGTHFESVTFFRNAPAGDALEIEHVSERGGFRAGIKNGHSMLAVCKHVHWTEKDATECGVELIAKLVGLLDQTSMCEVVAGNLYRRYGGHARTQR